MVDYIAASLKAGPVGIAIQQGSLNHALTVYGINTQTGQMQVADSDADWGGQPFTCMNYHVSGTNLSLDYPGYSNADLYYICTLDDVGWWTAGTGAWDNSSNWASRHAPNSAQAVYLTQSNVGLVTLGTTASVRSLTLSSSASLRLDSGANLTIWANAQNSGTIRQLSGATVNLGGSCVCDNAASGVYDLQGDVTLQGNVGAITNEGLFRKSAGTGTAYVSTNFFNTGTVEVDSGTLSIGSGTSTNGHYVFSNGGQLQATLTWQGETTADGNGVLVVSGTVAAGTTATFDNFTGGAKLQLGNLAPAAGATLNLNLSSINPATLAGASLGSGTVVNQGNLVWTGGCLQGSGVLTNQGSLTISGNGGQGVWGVLTNAGTIAQNASGSLYMEDSTTTPGGQHLAVLNNLAGALYDIQGDASISTGGGGSWGGPDGSGSSWPGGTINNAGLFRKSAGSGTSSVDPVIVFNNTGTVEVDSGTLAIGNGSSTTGHYEFSNGGRLQASFVWQGGNTANGNGVLAAGGSVTAGTTATFSSSGFTNGAGLEVGSGTTGSLYVDTGATLTLNMTGSQQAKMVGGSLRGPGTTTNLGNFAWSGGNIGDYSSGGTVVNQGNLVWTGGNLQGSGVLTNQGSLTIRGNGGQGVWGVLTNAGTIAQNASGSLFMEDSTTTPGGQHLAVLNNLAGALYDIQGDASISTGGGGSWGGPDGSGSSWPGGTINNAGLFRKSAGSGTSSVASPIVFNNTGTVEVDSGTLSIQGPVTQLSGSKLTAGTWKVGPNSTLLVASGSNITINQGSVTLTGAGSLFANLNVLAANQGDLTLLDGREFRTVGSLSNSGDLTVGAGSALSVTGLYTQTGGSTTVDGTFKVTGNVADIFGGVADFNTDLGSVTSATLTLNVTGAEVDFGSDQHLDTLSIGDGGKVVIDGAHVVVLNHLVMGGMDLGATTITPEPATMALLALGGLGVLARRWGKRRRCHT